MIKPKRHRFIKSPSEPALIITLWAVFALVESFIAVIWLVSTPGEAGSVFLFGLSKSRWVLLLGLIGAEVSFGYIAFHVWMDTKVGGWLISHLTNWVKKKLIYGVFILISLLCLLLFSQIWYLARVVADPYVRGYLQRLIPYIFLATTFSAHTLVLLPLLRYGSPSWVNQFEKKILIAGFISFGIILVISLIILLTGVGLSPDEIGWDAPGVPILPLQVVIAWGLGVFFFNLIYSFKEKDSTSNAWRNIDILLSLVLWASAVFLWAREPLAPSFFAPAPMAPNFEFYPHSDAALHDTMAQFLLMGDGFSGVARKPLYTLFLAILHGIAGQNYVDVVFAQILVVAFLPVLVYWLGKKIHHRVSGVIAAVLMILRETNALRLAGVVGVSNSKMLMSDLPATVFIVGITYALVLWAKNPSKHRLLPLGIGGCLGFMLLLRPQSAFLIPAVFLLAIFLFIKHPVKGLGVLGIIAIGLAVTVAPWLIRSYKVIGKFSLNDPAQMAFLTQQYHLEPGTGGVPRIPGESEAEYVDRINTYLKDFTTENLGFVSAFITSHFAHNQVEMVQALPVSFWIVQNPDSELFPFWRMYWERLWEECCSAQSYVEQIGYWDPQRYPIMKNQIIPMALNFLILSLGFGSVWVLRDVAGWIPLGVGLVYSLSTAVGRYSGWRLIMPADWVIFFYFAVGLGQVVIWFMSYLNGRSHLEISAETSQSTEELVDIFPEGNRFKYTKAIWSGLALLALGLTPIMVDNYIPKQYTASSEPELFTRITSIDRRLKDDFLKSEGGIVLQGRAMYPRFLKSGVGEPGSGWNAFSDRDFDRLGFILLSNSRRYNVIMPMPDAPSVFPNASDVIVLGCQSGEYIDALVIYFMDQDINPIIRISPNELSCPLPLP